MNAAAGSTDFRIVTRGVVLTLVLLAEVVAIDGGYSFRSAVLADAPLWRVVNETLQTLVYVAL